MRFLCLHGMGTNSRIFESQTAAIRHALGANHTYVWLDGSVPTEMAPGMDALVSADEEFLKYADGTSRESCLKALLAFEDYVAEEGPFDAVMGFSQGGGLAASFLIHRMQQNAEHEREFPTFRCAIFFSGGEPEDPSGVITGSDRRFMNYDADGEVIEIPTAHIWGKNDELYPTYGPVLSKICKASDREDFVHDGGHIIPGPRDPAAVAGSIRAIKRTLGRAMKV